MTKLTANKPAQFVGAADDPQGIELATMKERQRKIDAYPQLVAALREAVRELRESLACAIEDSGHSISGPTDTRAAENGEPAWVCSARATLAETEQAK